MTKPDPGNRSPRLVGRRGFIGASVAALAGLALWHYRRSEPTAGEAAPSGQPKMVKIVDFTDAGAREGIVVVPKIVKSEDEWRKQLSPLAFDVTRQAGTERAFTGEYWNLHDKGLFRCICCDTALFSSETKFESGTGWPSFWAPLAKENIQELGDNSLGVSRTAVSCRRCDAHLGHVFDDGPRPTGPPILHKFGGFTVRQAGLSSGNRSRAPGPGARIRARLFRIRKVKQGEDSMWHSGTERFGNFVRLLFLLSLSTSVACTTTAVHGQVPPFAGASQSPA